MVSTGCCTQTSIDHIGSTQPKPSKRKRLEFDKQAMQKLPEVHKTNLVQHARTARTRTWKKKSESLSQFYTSKGRKEGVGGKMARFMVTIAYGRGVAKWHQYTGNINAEMYATFLREHFPCMFQQSTNPMGKLFLQDVGCWHIWHSHIHYYLPMKGDNKTASCND